MLLAIDVGNTRLKWGLFKQGQWLMQQAIPLSGIAQFAHVLPDCPIQKIVIANVAGSDIAQSLEVALQSIEAPRVWVSGQTSQCGVQNTYEDPAQLGADRWAALIAARHITGCACLVVCAGTVTTIDVLDGDGVFQGGLIVPSTDLMWWVLGNKTAQLDAPPEPIVPHFVGKPYSTYPCNTKDAIITGCLLAQVGAIQEMFARVSAQVASNVVCVVSGGAGKTLLPWLTIPTRWVDNLVLEGLRIIANEED